MQIKNLKRHIIKNQEKKKKLTKLQVIDIKRVKIGLINKVKIKFKYIFINESILHTFLVYVENVGIKNVNRAPKIYLSIKKSLWFFFLLLSSHIREPVSRCQVMLAIFILYFEIYYYFKNHHSHHAWLCVFVWISEKETNCPDWDEFLCCFFVVWLLILILDHV